jgi:hypothetical protein
MTPTPTFSGTADPKRPSPAGGEAPKRQSPPGGETPNRPASAGGDTPKRPSPAGAEAPKRQSPPHGESRPSPAYGETGPSAPEGEAEAYGPDDPGYGPPDASWYERRKRERELEREREEEEFLAEAAEESPYARGAFEPRSRAGARAGSGKTEPTSLDLLLDAEDEDDRETDPLDQVKDMYLAAESVGGTDLDRRFEELLERQRTLIGAYFEQSRPEMPH